MVGAASVLLAVVSYAPSVWGVAVPLFTFVASLGLVASNTVASALESQGARAGLASALLGTAQFTTSSLVSLTTLSKLHNLLPPNLKSDSFHSRMRERNC